VSEKLYIFIAMPALLILVLLWGTMLSISLVPLLLLFLSRKITDRLSFNSKSNWLESNAELKLKAEGNQKNGIVFDRIGDVSKIIGCNTRNVQYRWEIFTNALERMQDISLNRNALDVGAGSLRDTYELSNLEFQVHAIDINKDQLELSYDRYDWTQVKLKPNIQARGILDLDDQNAQYDLILAFDVLEHLIELDHSIDKLRSKLKENGLIFISVPNSLTLFERLYKFAYKRRLKRGMVDKSGVPHVNFMTPRQWKQFFLSNGFCVTDQDIAIGFFVNDVWHGLYGICTRIFISPMLKRIVKSQCMGYEVASFENIFFPKWLMKLVNELDESTKIFLKNRWAWNLFVLGRKPIYPVDESSGAKCE
jgi:2-polyprenyl-3-methyl-5-hydroxy-6-metoxy-1,4-benzoquinol methylase